MDVPTPAVDEESESYGKEITCRMFCPWEWHYCSVVANSLITTFAFDSGKQTIDASVDLAASVSWSIQAIRCALSGQIGGEANAIFMA